MGEFLVRGHNRIMISLLWQQSFDALCDDLNMPYMKIISNDNACFIKDGTVYVQKGDITTALSSDLNVVKTVHALLVLKNRLEVLHKGEENE